VVNWTENRLNRLKLLHEEGYSASAIATRLGPAFTKSIVLRKLRELDAERARQAEARARRKAAKEAPLPAKPVPIVAAPPPSTRASLPEKAVLVPDPPRSLKSGQRLGTPLLKLRQSECRWPVDDRSPPRLFCGAPTVGGSSWCEQHQRVAFTNYGRPAKGEPHRGN
jgi:hypothetical protein